MATRCVSQDQEELSDIIKAVWLSFILISIRAGCGIAMEMQAVEVQEKL